MSIRFGFAAYCRSRAVLLIAAVFAYAISFTVVALGTPGILSGTLLYGLIIGAVVLAGGFFTDFLLTARFLRNISEFCSEELVRESLPERDLLLAILQGRERKYNNNLAKLVKDQEQSLEFFTAWIHELKTPSAAARIIASTGFKEQGYDKAKALLRELDRLDGDLERALFYIRSSSFAEDFMISDVNLKELVDACVRDHRTRFITGSISFSQEGTEISVKSDPLWLRFILDQFVQNSLKYTPFGGSIAIYAQSTEQAVTLAIQDSGCGIPQSDRERVFRRGFTGNNGRVQQEGRKSTGMGLFLAAGLAGKLGHRLRLGESGKGALFYLDFPSWSDFHSPAISGEVK